MQVSPVLSSFPYASSSAKNASSDLLEQTPPSPCPSASSGSELSFASSDTDATDYATTPPTSPSKQIDEKFRRISIDEGIQQIRRSSEDGGRASLSSLGFGQQQQHPRRGSADSGIPSSSLSTFQAVGPLTSASSFFGGKQPRTPSSGSASPSLSLAAKRTRISPGTIDLSSLPRFPPASPPPATLVTAASTDAPASSSSSAGQGAKTPQALTNGLFGSGSGSTPRALFPPTRPGLTSRWSTDSSGSDRAGSNSTSPVAEMRPLHEQDEEQQQPVNLDSDSEGSTSGSSCTSEECEICETRRMPSARLSQGAFPGAVDEAEDADGEEDGDDQQHISSTGSQQRRRSSLLTRSISTATITAEHSGSSPSSFGHHFRPPPSQSPYSPALNAFSNEAIRSPLPAFVAERSDMLPPAPKPHQMGFSPFVEEPLASTSREQQALLPSQTVDRASSNEVAPRRCRKCKRSHKVESSTSSSGSAASFQTSEESLSSNLLCTRPEPQKPLTRSQGLRIRDEGSSRPKGRYARVLSAQLHSSNLPSSSSNSNGGGNSGSSTMKTASALLDGTVSPAATSTDPLRIRLREMPGAITPGSQPPTPSPANAPHQLPSPSRTLATYSLTSPPKIARSTSASSSSSSSSSGRNSINALPPASKKSSWLSPAQMSDRRPSSPLHISTLAGDADEDNEAGSSSSSSVKAAAGIRKIGDTKQDIFSRSFSFANLESPQGGAGGPNGYIRSPLASPRSMMPTIKETEPQHLATQQGLNKVNPYFAGFI